MMSNLHKKTLFSLSAKDEPTRFYKTRGQRYRCRTCARTGTRTRPDNVRRLWHRRFVTWLTGSDRLVALAQQWRIGQSTLRSHFAGPTPAITVASVVLQPTSILILDGTTIIKHKSVALIARTPETVVTWRFALRECFIDW